MEFVILCLMKKALVLPGEIYVGGDSHTNTTGGIGALAVGLGHTDIAYVLCMDKFGLKFRKHLLFNLEGQLPPTYNG